MVHSRSTSGPRGHRPSGKCGLCPRDRLVTLFWVQHIARWVVLPTNLLVDIVVFDLCVLTFICVFVFALRKRLCLRPRLCLLYFLSLVIAYGHNHDYRSYLWSHRCSRSIFVPRLRLCRGLSFHLG